ncbi:GNAT family N-acetyltransferase [Vibrio makurazakiensis]|uniref:GNAT family N-acetyltransferase n=1 Tax=Vibrio makurazakiensis TaxID=2910250 RepID=UPI003D11290E
MRESDLEETAKIHSAAFIRQKQSYEWLQCNLNAAPRFMNFIAEQNGEIIGYIIWVQKSGFRPEAVIELEQLAVAEHSQGQGIGKRLITESLSLVQQQLASNESTLKHVLVTTRADNFAQKLYKDVLEAEVETTISNLYSADEVLMIARNVGDRLS